MVPGKEQVSDKSLMKELKKGNRLAFSQLYEQHWDALFQASFRVLKEADRAQDAVQEVFFDFWRRKETLELENVSGYLYKAVRFQSLKQLRKAPLLDIHQEHFSNVLGVNSTQQQLDLNQLEKTLNESLDELPPKYKEIFELSRFQNLSNKEIADQLELSQRTVDWYLHSVLKHLKSRLSAAGLLLLFIA